MNRGAFAASVEGTALAWDVQPERPIMLSLHGSPMTDAARRFEEARRLLVLATLSYRGFQSGLTARVQSERVHGAVARGLVELTDLCGTWELAWGPVADSAPLPLVDDALMLVVRARLAPNEYVVVVRGTNPGASFDWLLGDFWVGAQAPWDHNPGAREGGARISFSALLGLDLLRTMQAPPPAGPAETLAPLILTRVDLAGDQLRARLRPLAPAAGAEVRKIRAEALPLLAELDGMRRSALGDDPEARTRAQLAMWRSATRRRALRALAGAVAEVGEEQPFDLLRFASGSERLRRALMPGVTLIAFLQAALAAADGAPVRITVTGHGKGGALASTLALWLADTQGPARRDDVVAWDPERRARVHCVAFAGPTAGNAAFAAHSDATIGARCHRVVSPLDVVPQAWQLATLGTIPGLYADAPASPIVRELVAEIAAEVGHLGYTHVGSHVTALGGRENLSRPDFFAQAGHQHLAAYLTALGLDGLSDVSALFSPSA